MDTEERNVSRDHSPGQDEMLLSTPKDVTKSEVQNFLCPDDKPIKNSCSEMGRSPSEIQMKISKNTSPEDCGGHNGEVKSSEDAECENASARIERCSASDDLLNAAKDVPKQEVFSLNSNKTEPKGTETNLQSSSDDVKNEKKDEDVTTISKEILSDIGNTVDEFSRDSEKIEAESNFRNGEDKKPDDRDTVYSKALLTKHMIASETAKSEAESVSKFTVPSDYSSYDINLPIDIRTDHRMHSFREPKIGKSEGKSKSDNLRAVGRLLHDLGLDLVREQVYKDLIGIQISKDVKNMLDDKEKEQLKRLTDAHSKLIVKNAVYQLPIASCQCSGFASSSTNVLALHHEFGSTLDFPTHSCCLCEDCKTRFPAQFLQHLESAHQKKGRVQNRLAPNVCKYCPYEHKNRARMWAHIGKCFKKFNLNSNLQPLPADCDVPLMAKTSPLIPSQSLRPGMMVGSSSSSSFSAPLAVHHQVPKHNINSAVASNVQPSVMEIGGQLYSLVRHNGKALFTSLRSQIANVNVSNHNSVTPSTSVVPGNFPRFVQQPAKPVNTDRASNSSMRMPLVEKCEMCDIIVKDRNALWHHFRLTHKVELSRVSMIEKEPWMTCDVCLAKFWTYQGLTRHSMQLHKRELSSQYLPTKTFRCFLCLQTQTNPLNHLSTFHNITLLDMFHSRRCCMCNKKFRSTPVFEEHMVLQHHDIFANKEVLGTVLQALSTALSLKKQETNQPRPPNQAFISKMSPRHGTSSGSGTMGQVRSTVGAATHSFQQNSPIAHAHNRMHTLDKTFTPNKTSAVGAGQPEAKKRHRQSSEQPKGNDSSAVQTPPKKSTAEDTKELNKLYADYADIGRPILRSMRHRLSHNSSEKTPDDGRKETTANSPSNQTAGLQKSTDVGSFEEAQKSVGETNLSHEPLHKRHCAEISSSEKLDETLDTNRPKQLEEINGDVRNVAECGKTS